MSLVTMKELLEAGVHFGHQTRRWNPKMKPYIYGGRNGIYIIDLHQTLKRIDKAYAFVREVAAQGRPVLFVGTKKQAQDTISKAAERCESYHVNHRWLGGMLTNWATIRSRINRLRQLRGIIEDGSVDLLPKKEAARLQLEYEKLVRNLGGIEDMPALPGAVFIVDLKKEHLALAECRRLEIPTVAIVDTNCDPDEVDWIIPANDDAIRAIRLLTNLMADAVIDGRREAESKEADTGAEEGAVAKAAIDDEPEGDDEDDEADAEPTTLASRVPDAGGLGDSGAPIEGGDDDSAGDDDKWVENGGSAEE